MTDLNAIRWEKSTDGVVTLTLDDPGRRANTMNDALRASLAAAVERLTAEKDAITGVIVTSVKDSFLAGGDLRQLIRVTDSDAPGFTAQIEQVKGWLRTLETLGKMTGLGRPGRVRGAGFYDYDASGARTGLWPRLLTAFPSHGDPAGVDLHELTERLLFAEAVEAARCVAEGVVTSTADANIGSLLGIGFPPWTGGVLQYINGYPGGLPAFVTRADRLAAAHGERFAPNTLLREKPRAARTSDRPPHSTVIRSSYDRRSAVHRPVRGEGPQGVPHPQPSRPAQRDRLPDARRHRRRRPPGQRRPRRARHRAPRGGPVLLLRIRPEALRRGRPGHPGSTPPRSRRRSAPTPGYGRPPCWASPTLPGVSRSPP